MTRPSCRVLRSVSARAPDLGFGIKAVAQFLQTIALCTEEHAVHGRIELEGLVLSHQLEQVKPEQRRIVRGSA